jgi:cellulose synthase/poly-beta-1,6-N-acetylglucosamine synthase-like glycosyltransferase
MMNYPKISLLIAARNEEDNMLDLLNSIETLTYPKDKLEVLIGDDNSTDKTAAITRNFISQKPNYQLFTIKEQVNDLKAKTNILAQLAHHATGEYFFFTDADIELPKDWIQEILKQFDSQKVGVVEGTTMIKPNNWFDACQALEWLDSFFVIKLLSKKQQKVTAMGNNLACTAESYWAVGGYEKIGFSIIEDFALFESIVKKGYEFRAAYSVETLAKTKPMKGLMDLLHQRKRWMAGGTDAGPWFLVALAMLQLFFLPILVIIAVFSWKTALIVWLAAFVLQSIYCLVFLQKIKQMQLSKYLLHYDIYLLFYSFVLLIFFFTSKKTLWKGREY